MISVCLATFNGEKYLHMQLSSIIHQLNTNDEIIIVDDCSTDTTIEIIKSFSDDRIKLFKNTKNIGYVKSFEIAISHSKGDYIFLSDQDDYWVDSKVDLMINEITEKKSYLIISNMIETKEQGKLIIDRNFDMPKSSFFINIFNLFNSKSLYFGSLMCFKKELKEIVLPFPSFVLAHDIYIAFVANAYSNITHLDKILLLRTNTGINQTYKKRSLFNKISFKYFMLKSFLWSFKYIRFE